MSHIFRSFTIIVFNEAYVLLLVNLVRLRVGMKVGSAVAPGGQYRMRGHDDLSSKDGSSELSGSHECSRYT